METFDLQRMFVGDLSWGFALEIALRSSIMYVYTFIMVRVMGKRTAQQLTPFEFLIVIALGSAVGDPMFYPDVPLLAALLVITVIVGLEQVVSIAGQRSMHIARQLEGKPYTVVIDGRLDLEGMKRETVALEELFGELRREGVEQLGQVKYACVEQSGVISVVRYRDEQVRPGLAIIPPWDVRPPASYAVPDVVPKAGTYVCLNCGQRHDYAEGDRLLLCPACANDKWSDGVLESSPM
ncbi:MAG: DUF421 domain-containing protein [Caldilineaceae bacterium]|nr:DUF421 domain-containing protein [Caldilineaceae bacterium]